jgi:hypothetical protein
LSRGRRESRNAYKFSARNYGGKRRTEDLGVNDKRILILLLTLSSGDSLIHTVKCLPLVCSIQAR